MNIKDDWYKTAYNVNMSLSSWTFSTTRDIDIVLQMTQTKSGDRILDIACGYGRHAIELSKRGYKVTGVDISESLIQYAAETAKAQGLDTEFICCDIRTLKIAEKFDLIINLYDGAIGYLENDAENRKIFDVIAHHLKPGGKSLVHLHHIDFARFNFPQYLRRVSNNLVELIVCEWNEQTKYMFEKTHMEGTDTDKDIVERKRLYAAGELKEIFEKRGITVKSIVPDEMSDSEKGIHRYFYCLSENTQAL